MCRSILLLFSLLLGACSSAIPPAATATFVGPITYDQAIGLAMQIVSSASSEAKGEVVFPSRVNAQKMTLAEALKSSPGENAVPAGYDPQVLVWYVTMDGRWANTIQDPGYAATQQPLHHAVVILDTRSGKQIESWLTP
ncbi:MAG TPA: hypothetical protein VF784_14470 [Anaerolineales bacterium]